MICKNTLAHANAVEWFKTYFDLCGDYQPNSEEIHLNPMKLLDIYSEYQDELKLDHEELLEYKSWRKVWFNMFPHVRLREYKAVSGEVYILPINF